MKYVTNTTSEENILHRYFVYPTTNNTKMAETQTYDVGVSLAPFNVDRFVTVLPNVRNLF